MHFALGYRSGNRVREEDQPRGPAAFIWRERALRAATPLLLCAVLLFAVLGFISLFTLGPTGWPGRTSVLCCEPGKNTP